MSLENIDIFVKVVQSGSLSAASRLLEIPVTTISGRLSALEKRLGITLLYRTTRRLKLSREGELYYEHCLRAVSEMQAAENELVSTLSIPTGLLKLTASNDVAHSVLAPIVSEYLRRYPGVQVELVITNRYVDLIAEGVDLAIRAGELKDSSLVAKKFMPVQLALWATPRYLQLYGEPRSPQEMKDHTVFSHSQINARVIEFTQGQMLLPSEARFRADDLGAIKAMVLFDQGIGWLPTLMCGPELESGRLLRLLPEWCHVSGNLWFVYPAHRHITPKVRTFMEVALELTPDAASAPHGQVASLK